MKVRICAPVYVHITYTVDVPDDAAYPEDDAMDAPMPRLYITAGGGIACEDRSAVLELGEIDADRAEVVD